MPLYNLAADRQPDARPLLPGLHMQPAEGLKHLFRVFGLDAHAIVFHAEHILASVTGAGDSDHRFAAGSELQSV